MSLLSGPKEDLTGYIPDFGFELYDLHRFADDQIKGTIVSRVVLLLFKHIRDPDLRQKLPDILALLKTLMEKETGLQWLEVVIRYLTSVRDEDDLSAKKRAKSSQVSGHSSFGAYCRPRGRSWIKRAGLWRRMSRTLEADEQNLGELNEQARTFGEKQVPVLRALGVV